MASTSQRRDLDDPAVIRRFAKQIQNVETLSLLTLTTFADSQATSDKLWNGFKDSLLWALHLRAMRLISGATEFVRAEERQRELLCEEVARLMPRNLSKEELQAHFAALPPRYFQIHNARQVLDDLELAHRFMKRQISDIESPLSPVVSWDNQPDRGCNEVKVCTWDRSGLFWKIAGSFSAAGLNILGAQIFSRGDGIVLDTFHVHDARTGKPAGPEQRSLFEEIIEKALTGVEVLFPALIARQNVTRPVYQAYTGERIPTLVRFDNESSDTRTLIEIETEDRVGLLFRISQALAELELDISAARISTERGGAIDSFYVRDADGSKIENIDRQKAIERILLDAIAAIDAVKS
jgi:[protein-PII] uridylyltransferase